MIGDRIRPPNRRLSVTACAVWKTESAEHAFHITAGFNPADGRLVEVFYADGQKSGTNLRDTVQDACVLVSLLLQYGASIDEIGKSLSAAPDLAQGGTRPATILGTIVEALRGLELAA